MDFSSFCAAHYIKGTDKEEFAVWLGKLANESRPEESWLHLFVEFAKAKKGKR